MAKHVLIESREVKVVRDEVFKVSSFRLHFARAGKWAGLQQQKHKEF